MTAKSSIIPPTRKMPTTFGLRRRASHAATARRAASHASAQLSLGWRQRPAYLLAGDNLQELAVPPASFRSSANPPIPVILSRIGMRCGIRRPALVLAALQDPRSDMQVQATSPAAEMPFTAAGRLDYAAALAAVRPSFGPLRAWLLIGLFILHDTAINGFKFTAFPRTASKVIPGVVNAASPVKVSVSARPTDNSARRRTARRWPRWACCRPGSRGGSCSVVLLPCQRP